jgi:hypothetical protein
MVIDIYDDYLFDELECVGYIKGSQFLDGSKSFLGFLSEDLQGNTTLKDESGHVQYILERQDIIDTTMNRCIGVIEAGKILASELEFSRDYNASAEILEVHANQEDVILKLNTKKLSDQFFFAVFVYYIQPNLSEYR